MATQALLRWFSRSPKPASAPTDFATAAGFNPADFTPKLRTRLLVLQPTPFCNIDCSYCYLPDRNSTARMAMATLRHAAQRLVDDGLLEDELTIVWHAGEPLVPPPAWMDEAIGVLGEVLAPHGHVRHSVQTNATLVTDAWCALIRRHSIHVGVSVDGPAHLHDAHRRTRDGRGTHARVLDGMARLRAAGIPFHAIAVVTPATLAQADAFLDFFIEQGIHELGCNFDEAEGVHAQSAMAGQEAAHAAFLARLLERTARPDSPLVVRELAMARRLVAAPLPHSQWRGHDWPHNAQVLPFALVNVAHNGDFSTFSPELLGQPSADHGNFVFGNVATGGYLAAAGNLAFQRTWAAIVQGVEACEHQCAYFAHCGGGAPANKLYELGSLAGTETLYCRTMLQRPFDAVLARLEAELATPQPAGMQRTTPSPDLAPAPMPAASSN